MKERTDDRLPATAPFPHAEAWLEMLSGAATSHARLARALDQQASDVHATQLLQELERERGRVARELHAGLGQPLAGIKLNAELMEQWSGDLPAGAGPALTRIKALAESALQQARAVSHCLHPPAWQQVNLSTALRELAATSGVDLKFTQVQVDVEEISPEPEWEAKVALYRCAQECIANAIRHSEGSNFSLSLKAADGWLELRVSDNGRGISESQQHGGLGLRAIRHHAGAAGGECRILSALANGALQNGGSGRNQGTTIVVRVPAGS